MDEAAFNEPSVSCPTRPITEFVFESPRRHCEPRSRATRPPNPRQTRIFGDLHKVDSRVIIRECYRNPGLDLVLVHGPANTQHPLEQTLLVRLVEVITRCEVDSNTPGRREARPGIPDLDLRICNPVNGFNCCCRRWHGQSDTLTRTADQTADIEDHAGERDPLCTPVHCRTIRTSSRIVVESTRLCFATRRHPHFDRLLAPVLAESSCPQKKVGQTTTSAPQKRWTDRGTPLAMTTSLEPLGDRTRPAPPLCFESLRTYQR